MVGLVLVSHSKGLAESLRQLVLQMTAPDFPVAVAAGAGDDHNELGTDAVHISEVLQELSRPDGLLVLMDLGSAVLSAETALELFDTSGCKVRLCSAPLVEGAIAAAVQANAGGSLDEVAREAEKGLTGKQQQLQPIDASPSLVEAPPPTSVSAETAELVLTVENQHGLHARPAAAFVREVSKFSSSVQISNLTSGRGPASARSLTSLALLQIRRGDQIKILITGGDREAALQAIRELARSGFGEGVAAVAPPTISTLARAVLPKTKESGQVHGVPGSDGIAIGPLLRLESSLPLAVDEPADDPAAELEKLTAAMKDVSQELSPANLSAASGIAAQSAEILGAQALLLSDSVLLERLKSGLQEGHKSAARVWTEVTEELAAQYQSMDDEYLRERAADIRDIGRRVLRKLCGAASSGSIQLDHPAILFAPELLPSEADGCDPATVLGVITSGGSATSHSAILLRTRGIPMVVGTLGIDEKVAGKTVAIDGSTGEVWIEPDDQTMAALRRRKQELLDRQKQVLAARLQPSVTLDGIRMQILANVGNVAETRTAAENGAEGVGLLRTEFLFLQRFDAPSEEEQIRTLRDIYEQISGPIVVRTLDVGADKPLPFLPQPEEHNPYLGLRGIRLSLRTPELFLPHLRAILTAGAKHDTWLMFPMISTEPEVHDALQILEQAHRDLVSLGRDHAWPIKRGAMIEVPSAALMTEQLAEELDFFSIGTNDLTQYVMAAERGNASVTELQDAVHPSILRLIQTVVDGAHARDRHVSVCGDAASDPVAAAILAGLGIGSLSVRPKQVAEIKALFRSLKMADLKHLAKDALSCRDATQVRNLAKDYLYAAPVANRD